MSHAKGGGKYEKIQTAIYPDTYTAATKLGEAIDTVGFQSLTAFLSVNSVSSQSGTASVDAKLQECATSGGSYTDITGATFTQKTAQGEEKIHLDLDNGTRLRYIKILATNNGGTPSHKYSATAVLHGARTIPVT